MPARKGRFRTFHHHGQPEEADREGDTSGQEEAAKDRFIGPSILLWAALLSPVLGIALLLGIASGSDLPDTETLANPKTDLATRIYAVDGAQLGSFYRENRADVRYADLPPTLVQALICTEDVRFREHTGVDFRGLARAIAYLGKKGGGSTVTQQLAKQLFTERYDRTGFFERAVLQKPKEWIIATRLERQYTKDEILALYLNRYDFLNQAVGIRSAAQVYFGKPVSKLELHESAMLVGMLKNSALYNPLRRPELVQERRGTVIAQMVKYGVVPAEARDSLNALPLGLSYQRVSHDEGPAPHFRERLRAEVKGLLDAKDEDGEYQIAKADGASYDLYRDGLVIHTTIDSRLQRYAEEAANRHIRGELQEDFWRDLKRTTGRGWPFSPDIEEREQKNILKRAVEQSRRYRLAMGKECPECERPGFYIAEQDSAGQRVHVCRPGKGGCGHAWPVLSRRELDAEFEEGGDPRDGVAWLGGHGDVPARQHSPPEDPAARRPDELWTRGAGRCAPGWATWTTSGPNSTMSFSHAVRSARPSSPLCTPRPSAWAWTRARNCPTRRPALRCPKGRTRGALKTVTSPMGRW